MSDCLSLALLLEGFGAQGQKSRCCLGILLFRKPEWNGTQMLADGGMSGDCVVGRVMSIVCWWLGVRVIIRFSTKELG